MAEHSAVHSSKRRRLSFLQGQPQDYVADMQGHLFAKVDVGDTGSSEDSNITISTKFAGQTITPFLTQHIPARGAGGATGGATGGPNTKYCYRHRPDLKCRRQANEPSMDQLQHVRYCDSSKHALRRLTLFAGARDIVTERSTRHCARLDALFRGAVQAPAADASRHTYTMLLPAAVLSISQCPRSYTN